MLHGLKTKISHPLLLCYEIYAAALKQTPKTISVPFHIRGITIIPPSNISVFLKTILAAAEFCNLRRREGMKKQQIQKRKIENENHFRFFPNRVKAGTAIIPTINHLRLFHIKIIPIENLVLGTAHKNMKWGVFN